MMMIKWVHLQSTCQTLRSSQTLEKVELKEILAFKASRQSMATTLKRRTRRGSSSKSTWLQEKRRRHSSLIELYGFFSWNLSALAFVVYMIWAFVPDRVLNDFGIYYIPDKYYAIAFPLWFAVTAFTILQLYVTICMWATPSIESYETLQDKHTILKNPNIEREAEQPSVAKDAAMQGETTNLASASQAQLMQQQLLRHHAQQAPLRGVNS